MPDESMLPSTSDCSNTNSDIRSNEDIHAHQPEQKRRRSRHAVRECFTTFTTRLSTALADRWIGELVALVLATALVVALATLLSESYGNQTISWRSPLSLTTTIAVMARASQVLLAIPIASSLSQMGWLHFSEQKTLLVFQSFHTATRTPFGTLRLVFAAPSLLAVLALVTVVLGLMFEPAVQQCLEVIIPSSIPILQQLLGVGDYPLGVQMLFSSTLLAGAEQSFGTISANSTSSFAISTVALPDALDYACASSGCQPPPYITLSFCSACEDVGDALYEHANGSLTLPSGEALDADSLLSLTSHSVKYGLTPPWLGGNLTLANFTIIESWKGAQRCLVNLCTVIYQLNVETGTTAGSGAIEIPLASSTHCTLGQPEFDDNHNPIPPYWNIAVPSLTSLPTSSMIQQNINIDGDAPYGIDNSTLLFLSKYFTSIFNGNVPRSILNDNSSTLPTTDFAVWAAGTGFRNMLALGLHSNMSLSSNVGDYLGEANPHDAQEVGLAISTIATSMANAARNYAVAVGSGQGVDSVAAYHIRWTWFALPVIVDFMVAALLFSVIWQTRPKGVPVWKTSAMAIMFRGIGQAEDVPGHREPLASEMDSTAAKKRAKLTATSSGYRLSEVDEHID